MRYFLTALLLRFATLHETDVKLKSSTSRAGFIIFGVIFPCAQSKHHFFVFTKSFSVSNSHFLQGRNPIDLYGSAIDTKIAYPSSRSVEESNLAFDSSQGLHRTGHSKKIPWSVMLRKRLPLHKNCRRIAQVCLFENPLPHLTPQELTACTFW